MKKAGVLFFLLVNCFGLFAQQKVPNISLAQLIKQQDSLHMRLPVEKLYVQTDRSYYNSGDTIRFKCYLFNSDFLLASTQSGILYVELDDVTGKAAKRIMVPVAHGLSWGDIALDEKEIPQGGYTLRAYTNWQRNFGEDYIYKKDIYISHGSNTSTLIKADFKQVQEGGKDKITASLRFTDLDKHALGVQDIQMRIINGTHTISKAKATTGVNGVLDLNFDLADKTAIKNLTIQAQQLNKDADTAVMSIPVVLNRPENTDLQFMPEGGNMVAGIETKIGFKAIGEDGRGVDVSGKVYNSKQEEVATFASLHKGMGSFTLTPNPAETYTAKITLKDGIMKTYPLPQIKASGTILNIQPQKTATATNDSLYLTLSVTPDLQNSIFYLMGNLREAFYASTIRMQQKPSKTIAVAKNLFPSGIVHFTLFNTAGQPLNERIVYVDHGNDLNITINPSQKTYSARDSIALNISVTDRTGKPIQGSFSLAVTDDGQVRTDSLGSNIANNLLLTSDLKGTIEDPAYYLKSNPQSIEALDNLLLTQGWIGYDWKQLFETKTQPVQYAAEAEYSVKGRVFNGFNKPIADARLSLLSPKPLFITDTVTGKDGKYAFKGMFPGDSTAYVIKAKKKNGSANVLIEAEEFKPLLLTTSSYRATPWYINSDTLLLHNMGNNLSQRLAEDKLQYGGKMLKPVTINDKKFIPDSKNLNGSGNADFILDEKVMEKQQKKTLEEILAARFKMRSQYGVKGDVYHLNDRFVILFIDGVPPSFFNLPADLYMNGLYADQIKAIEIMYTDKYEDAYELKLLGREIIAPQEETPVFIEVTTFAGSGIYINKTPNLLVYHPMPFALPKQFYSPKYPVKNLAAKPVPDLPSTIYWEPNIVTDKDGKATVSFYASDRPDKYTVTMEGSDMQGKIGSAVTKLVSNKISP